MAAQSAKELYCFATPWPVYAMNWCQRPGSFRMGLGSFVTDRPNKITIIERTEQDPDFVMVDDVDQSYPSTKLLWAPYKGAGNVTPDLFATTGDFLKIWELRPREAAGHDQYRRRLPPAGSQSSIVPITVLKNQRRPNSAGHAPITSMDWNETDPNMVITCSVDTTCTVWDISTQQAKTQLIAHDREVYDVAFSRGSDVFASVGADGSLRMFDLRNLEHSTILYEAGPVPPEARVPPSGGNHLGGQQASGTDILPLLRLSWNKQDPNYIATFQTDSTAVLIMDVRVPAIPVTELRGHGSVVTAIGWAPHSSSHICTAADDKQALVWDISQPTKEKRLQDPILAYSAEAAINQMSWSASAPDWVGIACGLTVQALRV
ncbi:WD40-repeat-containing domain protein [Geranomyces variabilis]|nr:WD40-repeat-containing domain protein [Geranomyces variabilis]KAJ3142334.1 ddb1 and cul4 associated factor 7 [Geranomyces variabilis]